MRPARMNSYEVAEAVASAGGFWPGFAVAPAEVPCRAGHQGSDSPGTRQERQQGLRPGRLEGKHQLKIFASPQAPGLGLAELRHRWVQWQGDTFQPGAATAAGADRRHGCRQPIAAVAAAHPPGGVRRPTANQGTHRVKAGPGAAVGPDGSLPQTLIQLGGGCRGNRALQQGQPQAAQAVGAGAYQPVAGAAVTATDRSPGGSFRSGAGKVPLGRLRPGQPPDRRDRQDPLGPTAAVAPQQHAAIDLQGLPQAAIHPFHPGPGRAGRRHQAHREPQHFAAAHRGQIGEVRSGGPPAHILWFRGGLTEMQALHQHIRVHHHP